MLGEIFDWVSGFVLLSFATLVTYVLIRNELQWRADIRKSIEIMNAQFDAEDDTEEE